MKKLSLKKTTLSRLNNDVLSKVKGGDNLDHDIDTSPKYCVLPETSGCNTEFDCAHATIGCDSLLGNC
ncbi:class I lanthipeptide [Labilibaculum euxinus]|uniref:Uncharacterized protein n=1 Tax=Labilibaculum euxinus TaxID=2686357 RepID=A0A7M4D3Y3_9BACT|nr:class I lanthipeptide [Labilibaculum euxinus]MUP37362.1 hypothetical protein [Labilibaculum euxinus]MVB06567.1 hypothetical protein [Labilibaculum euxinus]